MNDLTRRLATLPRDSRGRFKTLDIMKIAKEQSNEIEKLRQALKDAMIIVNIFTREGDAVADAVREQSRKALGE